MVERIYATATVHKLSKNLGATSKFYAQKGKMRQIPYSEPTTGHLHTKFSFLGNQAPRIWAPLYDRNICMCDSEQVSR
jgi:hypothetical protein